MCGIVGMIGKENVTESLIQGLTKLEYRGYDSAGICVNDQSQQPHVVKAVGGIADLAAKLTPEIDGTVGIGHTRWAMANQLSPMHIPMFQAINALH